MYTKFKARFPRLTNHLWLIGFGLICLGVAAWLGGPDQLPRETISLVTGYAAMLLVLFTLVIGPLNLFKVRKNPVNLNIRRDAGIWAGITAIVHVIFSFQIFFNGDLLRYFLEKDGSPQLNLFGLSNDVGLVALLVIVFLLILSNNFFLKRLKGKRWKNLQRFNYLLFGLTMLHTFGQQLNNSRNEGLIYGVTGLSAGVVVAQLIGVVVYRRRAAQRQGAAHPGQAQPAFQPATPAVTRPLGRRRFMAVAGAASLTGLVTVVVARQTLFKDPAAPSGLAVTLPEVPVAPTASPAPTATASPAPVSTTAPTQAAPGSNSSRTRPGNNIAGNPAPTATAGTGSTTGQTTPAASNTAAITGTVLATLATLPVGSVKQFRTPGTNKNAFVVREADGAVKAFSGICTHRPYDLVYDQSGKQFYCDLHDACFETVNGKVTRGPARTALTALAVKVDAQGNIIYSSI